MEKCDERFLRWMNCTMLAALLHCDKHVVKMIIEYPQLMSTAHRVLDGDCITIKPRTVVRSNDGACPTILIWKMSVQASHINHPSAIWTRENDSNYTLDLRSLGFVVS